MHIATLLNNNHNEYFNYLVAISVVEKRKRDKSKGKFIQIEHSVFKCALE